MREARFLIAELVFELKAAGDSGEFEVPSSYKPFQLDGGAEADISFVSHVGGIPRWEAEPVFDSKGPWRLWRQGEGYLITLHSSLNREEPYQIARVDSGFSTGETWMSEKVFEELAGYFPLNYPLDEVLAVNRLALGHGIEVHACGIDDHGQGILFLGVSGAGKSTISKLWDAEDGVLVLSDDRIIITVRDGGYWIHGTPWHGDAGLADPGGVPLKAIFFISHAPENKADNEASPLGAGQCASRLLARSFPTFWNRDGMQFSADLAAGIASHTPAFSLEFVPEVSVLSYVRNLV
ncbi:MAG: hypothetical protein ACYDGS_08750 [Thermoleophilia bacterium]